MIKEQFGDCTLYLGDCLDILPEIGQVDAVVTDPPYGINKDKGAGTGGERKARVREYAGGWDHERPKKEIFEMMLEKSTNVILWGGNYFTDYLPVSGKWLFWDKVQTMPTYSDGELAWTSLRGVSVKRFTYNGSGMFSREKERFHPTQKPVELMKWCIDFIPKSKTILDPFMGSGSTGLACVNRNRKFIGIEKDPEYFEIACKRIEDEQRQGLLF